MQAEEDEQSWNEMEECQQNLSRCIGIESDGWVATEWYAMALKNNAETYEEWAKTLEEQDLLERNY